MFERILAFLIIIFYSFTSNTFAKTGLDFELPKPPQAQLVETKPLSLGGREIQTFLYATPQESESVLDFYEDFFKAQGFEKILETEEKKRDKTLLRFKKDDLVVSVAVITKPTETQIVVAKFLQPEGALPPEKLKPSIKDFAFSLPEKDCPGEDLSIIPRPAQSVRWLASNQIKQVTLIYSTSLTTQDTKSFYKSQMPYQGWKLEKEVLMNEALEQYKSASGKKSLGIQSPFEGLDFEQVIGESFILDFKASFGKARITIFPNFVDRNLGSVVQILYNEGGL